MLKDFMEKHNISKLYTYHEEPRDKRTVEFGWIDSESISLDGPVVVSRAPEYPEADSAVSLADYREYFLKLTSQEPSEFIERWEPSPREYELYWYSNMPHAEAGLHEFVMKLAYLLRDGEAFEHQFERHLATFEIVEVTEEASEAEVSEEYEETVEPTGDEA